MHPLDHSSNRIHLNEIPVVQLRDGDYGPCRQTIPYYQGKNPVKFRPVINTNNVGRHFHQRFGRTTSSPYNLQKILQALSGLVGKDLARAVMAT